MSTKKRYEFDMSKEEVTDFLRALATAIDQDASEISGYNLPLPNYHKLKVSLKQGEDNLRLKLKLKHYETADDEEDEYFEIKGREEYKKLKKRMKTYFEEIGDSLKEKQFPSREIVSVFLKDSETMVAYEDNGEEFYAEYREACTAFGQAFEAEDLDRFRKAYERLGAVKDQCHAKHKD